MIDHWNGSDMADVVQELPSAELRSVLVWRPGELDSPQKAPGVLTSACCLRSTVAGDRAVVYRTMADQGIVGIYDFLSDAERHPDRGWAAVGVLHQVDPYLPRADLLADENLARVFAHIQGRRTIPVPAARRLMGLLPNPPFAT